MLIATTGHDGTRGQATSLPKQTITFEDFKKQKEAIRQSLFKKSEKKMKPAKQKKSEPVKVQVGLVTYDCDANNLKKVKGRTIPILLETDADADSLLSTAVEKHGRHFKQFDASLPYVVLYSDMSLVNFLPGSAVKFTLQKYKDDLLKPYSKIYFWLCAKDDFEDFNERCSSDESDLGKPSIYIRSPPSPIIPTSTGSAAYASPTTTSTFTGAAYVPPTTSMATSSGTSAATTTSSLPAPIISIEDDDTGTDPNHQCPTCLVHFPLNKIEEHADLCAEGWVDPIGQPVFQEEPEEQNTQDDTNESHDETVNFDDDESKLGAIKKAVVQLQKLYNTTNSNLINIRRSTAFKDYSASRKKKWFKPKNLLKVTFLGEPAVDDGGPRREFFSGKKKKQSKCRDGGS